VSSLRSTSSPLAATARDGIWAFAYVATVMQVMRLNSCVHACWQPLVERRNARSQDFRSGRLEGPREAAVAERRRCYRYPTIHSSRTATKSVLNAVDASIARSSCLPDLCG
jgi:hypothetical protein